MLYQIYENQRSLMEPFADLAEVAAKLYNNAALPIAQHPLAQRVAAGYDLMHRLGKDYEKPAFGINQVAVEGVDVAIFERVEIDKPFCELRRFKRFTDDAATLTNPSGRAFGRCSACSSAPALCIPAAKAAQTSTPASAARVMIAIPPACSMPRPTHPQRCAKPRRLPHVPRFVARASPLRGLVPRPA